MKNLLNTQMPQTLKYAGKIVKVISISTAQVEIPTA
jgi:hypothetical protein